MKMLAILFSIFMSQAVVALDGTANSCDDYYPRHNKRDLKPLSMTFQDKNLSDPYQEVKLRVQNVGNLDITGTGSVWMAVNIKGNKRKIALPRPIAAGQILTLSIAVDPGLLHNCENVPVVIDLDHNVGQYGCQVWNNDDQTLMAQKVGGLCRIIRPIDLPPINFPHIRE